MSLTLTLSLSLSLKFSLALALSVGTISFVSESISVSGTDVDVTNVVLASVAIPSVATGADVVPIVDADVVPIADAAAQYKQVFSSLVVPGITPELTQFESEEHSVNSSHNGAVSEYWPTTGIMSTAEKGGALDSDDKNGEQYPTMSVHINSEDTYVV
eukprot:CFRG4159T1